jgi:hypothetical protein
MNQKTVGLFLRLGLTCIFFASSLSYGLIPGNCFVRVPESCWYKLENYGTKSPVPELYAGHPVELIRESSHGHGAVFLGAVGSEYFFASSSWGIDPEKRQYSFGLSQINRIIRIHESQITAAPSWTYNAPIERISATRFRADSKPSDHNKWERAVISAASLIRQAELESSIGTRGNLLTDATRALRTLRLPEKNCSGDEVPCRTMAFFEKLGIKAEFTQDPAKILVHLRSRFPAILSLMMWDQTGSGPPFPLPTSTKITVEDLEGNALGSMAIREPSFAAVHKGHHEIYLASGLFRTSTGVQLIPAYHPESETLSLVSGRTLSISSPSERLHSAVLLYPRE